MISGLRLSQFSVTINTRFYPEGLWQLFYEAVVALEQHDARLVSFLTREVLLGSGAAADFDAAVQRLSTAPLVADVYYTVAGT